jgi:hypothetical protein
MGKKSPLNIFYSVPKFPEWGTPHDGYYDLVTFIGTEEVCTNMTV